MANAVLSEIYAEARRRKLPIHGRRVLSAIETGIVEAHLTNPEGGDADSAGWRQERASLYKDPTNLRASVRRYFDEAEKLDTGRGSAGQLAARVQRPREDLRGRYDQVSGRASRLLRATAGGSLTSSSPGGLTPRAAEAAPQLDMGAGADVSPLLAQLGLKQAPPVSAPAAPQLGGGPPMPAGYQVPQGAAPVPQQDQTSALMAALQTQGGDVPQLGQPNPASSSSGGGAAVSVPRLGGGRATKGVLKITGPNPGRIKPEVLDFGRRVSAIYGKPLVGSDGTGHSYRTVNGNVSQHSIGEATDVPATGRELIRMGQAALIAAGMPRAQALKQTGGLFNVGDHQVIFNTHEGGDHTDHLHISARSKRR